MNREVISLYVVEGEESLHNDEYSTSQSVCQPLFEKFLIFFLQITNGRCQKGQYYSIPRVYLLCKSAVMAHI